VNRIISITTTLIITLLWQFALSAAPVDVVPAEDVGMSSERLAVLKAKLHQVLDDERTGGIQVLIARRGKVVMHENLGFANIEEKTPVTDETLFRIYSMTKPVMGVAMMMLYEDGYFSLADPISKHIPEFAGLEVFAGVDGDGNMILEAPNREPTIHDLLQHTAGFTYGIFGNTPVDKAYLEKQIGSYDESMQEMIDKLADTPLLYQPGQQWVYSMSVDIQGYLIEKWSGMELSEFLQERLFDPLQMDQTMAWVPADKASLLATVYTHNEDHQLAKFDNDLVNDHFRAPGHFSGGGQLISTSDDYWRFSQMLLNGGTFEGHRYLSPRTVKMMRSNRLPEAARASYPRGGFGLNFGIVIDNTATPYPASNGEFFWGGLATTHFWIDPEEEMIVIMLTQYLPYDSDFYRDLMHRMVYSAVID